MDTPLWTPTAQQIASANLTRFIEFVRQTPAGGQVADYDSLYRWSIEHYPEFWAAVWEFCGVAGAAGYPPGHVPGQPSPAAETVLAQGHAPLPVVTGQELMQPWNRQAGPKWFPEGRLNFAENLLRYRDDRPALAFWNEHGKQRSLTFAELYGQVARLAAALQAQGVGCGDRVAGFMPNLPETVIAMLAAASLGAVWSSCSPDFGIQGVLDRFGQIEPKVLFTADAYLFKGKTIDCLERVRGLIPALPSLERVVVVPYMNAAPDISGMPGTILWSAFVDEGSARGPRPLALDFARLPFDHPLYIMYSSGTTGLPKCMVHGAGGTLLQHLKELVLHTDLKRDDVIFYYTTCGWMMWNWLVSSLAVGATVVLYDGFPFAPHAASLWDMAQAEGITVFGTSAKYLALLEKEGVRPRQSHRLPALRAILSTGSPLLPESFDYVYRDIKPDVQLASISGGTDIISCFALGNPLRPVWRGELQGPGLGMAVQIFDDAGGTVDAATQPGELVCVRPFPSMPVCFWHDPDGAKYRAAYYETYPGVWRHGDWVAWTAHGGLVIYGRSDATLNPGGVRIGTAEIYNQVEGLPEIVEALVVGQDWQGDVRIVLFVRLREGAELTDDLRERIRRRIREGASPHHVPKKIIAVADIPRTISGKISELAVRNVIHGRPVKNTDALANPQALELYRELEGLKT
jgi:acetoacetyl-CoA synthetase